MGVTVRKAGLAAGVAVLAAGLAIGVAMGIAAAAPGSQARTAVTNPGRMYGNPAAAAPYWRQQSLDDCALMAAADVIGELTGREPTEREIIAVAQNLASWSHPGPIYMPPRDMRDPNGAGRGADPHDIPVLLARYGITAVFTGRDQAPLTGVATGLEALERYLAAGHKVIAGVNAELIWGMPVQTRDQYGAPTADHAVVVTGVDTAAGTVHLNDSGNPQGRDEQIPVDLFVRTWATSGNQMVVTAEDAVARTT
ncbi:C39 family peptidase [Mycobacterium decipiens]|uniref:Peptidase C39-like domain-containing protein n=1 Tax=Mycobacterium decipiens TaxID=1430326 RepID=A0A1X2LWL6_9MYCO|nr:hypothetical protein B8W66_08675 [Mycobacterium decipiens]